MSSGPTTLLTHRLPRERADDLHGELADRIDDIDLRVARTAAESRAALADAEIVLTHGVTPAMLDAADRLRWIHAVSAGVDHYDLDRLRGMDVALTSSSGVHAEPAAEQALGYMLAFARGIHTGIRRQERGVWERYTGDELRGRTLGVVGLGEIGSRVAELGSALGMEVIGTKLDPSNAPDAVEEAFGPDGLDEVLARVDYLALCCSLTEETRGLIGERELRAMPESAVLVNVARGEVVDEDALTVALQEREIRGASLDVFHEEPLPEESTLWSLSNAIVTPHMAGTSPHKSTRIADLFAENYRRFGAGEDLLNREV